MEVVRKKCRTTNEKKKKGGGGLEIVKENNWEVKELIWFIHDYVVR